MNRIPSLIYSEARLIGAHQAQESETDPASGAFNLKSYLPAPIGTLYSDHHIGRSLKWTTPNLQFAEPSRRIKCCLYGDVGSKLLRLKDTCCTGSYLETDKTCHRLAVCQSVCQSCGTLCFSSGFPNDKFVCAKITPVRKLNNSSVKSLLPAIK